MWTAGVSGSVWPQLLLLQGGALALGSGRPGLGLWISAAGDGKDWTHTDVVAQHNRSVPAAQAFASLLQTTGYVGLSEIDDDVILMAYDRTEGLSTNNNKVGDMTEVYTVRIHVTVQAETRPAGKSPITTLTALKLDDGEYVTQSIVHSVSPGDADVKAAQAFAAALLAAPERHLSFRVDGEESGSLLASWPAKTLCSADMCSRSWDDPKSGLVVKLNVTNFTSDSGVWWVVGFENHGTTPTSIVSDVRPLQLSLPAATGNTSLRFASGSLATAKDFQPQEVPLEPGSTFTLPPELSAGEPGESGQVNVCSGRSSDGQWDVAGHDVYAGAMPFFGLDFGDGSAINTAIGWTGLWQANVSRGISNVSISAGLASSFSYWHGCDVPKEPGAIPEAQCADAVPIHSDSWLDGSDYRNFELASNSSKDLAVCRDACCADPACMSFGIDDHSPVPPGLHNCTANTVCCWLKNAIPSPKPSPPNYRTFSGFKPGVQESRPHGLHARLNPGERIRTPSILMQFTAATGDRFRATNLWRRLMLRHFSGLPTPSTSIVSFGNEVEQALPPHNRYDAAAMLQQLKIAKEKNVSAVGFNTFWMDAGWSAQRIMIM